MQTMCHVDNILSITSKFPARKSEMTNLGRRFIPSVVPAIQILHRHLCKDGRFDVVQRGDIDAAIGAAELLNITMTIGGDAAGGAEMVASDLGAELIEPNRIFR